jgi:aryl-alcohol dehydrogenase-like predicted oxidoreductase
MTDTSNRERVTLGKTDIKIAPLGIGAWSWGDRLFWNYGITHTFADVQAAFETSVAAGVTFFDTAETYGRGRSEQFLGQFVGSNGQAVVATKFMPYPWRLRRQSLVSALRNSLRRLGLSQVDLYQIHWPFPPVSIDTWMDALSDVVATGMARAAGVSNYNLSQMRRAQAALARRGVPLASNQVEYSLLHRAPDHNGLLEACRELGVTLIAYSPLRQGLLTGKYTPENRPSGLHRRRFTRRYLAQVQPLIVALHTIGAAHGGKTAAQVALNWVICKGAVPIPGAKNARQAEQNAEALGWRLTDDEVADLERVSAEVQSL